MWLTDTHTNIIYWEKIFVAKNIPGSGHFLENVIFRGYLVTSPLPSPASCYGAQASHWGLYTGFLMTQYAHVLGHSLHWYQVQISTPIVKKGAFVLMFVNCILKQMYFIPTIFWKKKYSWGKAAFAIGKNCMGNEDLPTISSFLGEKREARTS